MRKHSGVLSSSVPSLSNLSVYLRDALLHGDVRSGKPCEPVAVSSYTMPLILASHRWVQGQDSDISPRTTKCSVSAISLRRGTVLVFNTGRLQFSRGAQAIFLPAVSFLVDAFSVVVTASMWNLCVGVVRQLLRC